MRRLGVGAVQSIPPAQGGAVNSGGLHTAYSSRRTAALPMTTTEVKLAPSGNFAGSFGFIVRSAGDFTCSRRGMYQISLMCNVQQLVAANETWLWTRVNGTSVDYRSMGILGGAVNDWSLQTLVFQAELLSGDVVNFWGQTSAVNGSQLFPKAAAGAIPAISPLMIGFLGFNTGY